MFRDLDSRFRLQGFLVSASVLPWNICRDFEVELRNTGHRDDD